MKCTMMRANRQKSTEARANQRPRGIFALVVSCIFALASSPALYGQATGSFSGNVTDKSGSGIAGATVIATAQGTGLIRDHQYG